MHSFNVIPLTARMAAFCLLGLTLLASARIQAAAPTNSSAAQAATIQTGGPVPTGQEPPARRAARMAWWREARFGLFIHYGPVTLTGKEISWSRANSNPKCPNKGPTPVEVYDNLYKEFNPTNFNAREWTGIAKAAGMKYVVLTAKHCDGFLLWDSKVDAYNILNTPFKRDLCADLAKAARQEGLKLGWYFSPMDWRDPDFRTERNAAFISRMQGELRELLSNYGTIDVMWFDHDAREAVYDQDHTYALVKQLQPEIIINNRLDLGVGLGNRLILNPNADFYTPEQTIGAYDDQRPWETCMTLGGQWSWRPNDKLKSAAEIVSLLCRVVGGDGNLLLNVGPMPDGRIEPRQVEVLRQVGEWMDINGESIYGTRGGPWKPTPHLTSTRKGNAVYVHVLQAARDSIELPALPCGVKSASVLGGGEIKVEAAGGKFILHLPEHRKPLATVIKLNLDVPAMDLPASLPPLPPMPAIPNPLPPDSVPLGDPKDQPETKMDFPIAAGPFAPTWDSINANYPGQPAWLREAKFGVWVHFGPQAAGQSGDWYARRLYDPNKPAYTNHLKNHGHPSEVGYKDVLRGWNPKNLKPAELVKTYHDAGARFLILQGVHHDNFDNWNSRYQPWNSLNLGPRRDLLGEWSAAARKLGLRYGVSFHHDYTWWWYQSAFGSDETGPKAGVPYDGNLTPADGQGKWWSGLDPRMLYTINLLEYSNINTGNIGIAATNGIFTRHRDYARWYATWWALRIMDVIDQYDPDFIYTDGNSTQPFTGERSASGFKCDAAPRVVAHFYNHTLATRGKVDTFSIIKFHPPTNGIVTTEEGTYPRTVKTDQPWIGENAVGDWFYAPDFTYDAGAVIRCLLEYVSRDGNYAVCVSLQPDGSLDAGSKNMLREIGDWLRVNGEGIYGSKGWVRFGEGDDAKGKIKTLPTGQLGRKQAEFRFSPDDFRFTVGKDGSLYAWCLTVPDGASSLRIKSMGTAARLLPKQIQSVALLGSSEQLAWKQTEDGLEIQLPEKLEAKYVLGFKITSMF